jgi:hypothetical protein
VCYSCRERSYNEYINQQVHLSVDVFIAQIMFQRSHDFGLSPDVTHKLIRTKAVTSALTGHDRTQQMTIDFAIHRCDTFSEQPHANTWNCRESATANAVRIPPGHFSAVSSIFL